MPNTCKNQNRPAPRHDLKGRLARGGWKYARFARANGFNAKTLYAVLDGYRTGGPEAQRIIRAIKAT